MCNKYIKTYDDLFRDNWKGREEEFKKQTNEFRDFIAKEKQKDSEFAEATRKIMKEAIDNIFHQFAYGTKLTPEEQKLEEKYQKLYGHSPFVDLIPDTWKLVFPNGQEIHGGPAEECEHVWKSYLGLAEQFEYCEICDKRKDK